jgi:hypothetical protein
MANSTITITFAMYDHSPSLSYRLSHAYHYDESNYLLSSEDDDVNTFSLY